MNRITAIALLPICTALASAPAAAVDSNCRVVGTGVMCTNLPPAVPMAAADKAARSQATLDQEVNILAPLRGGIGPAQCAAAKENARRAGRADLENEIARICK